MSIRKIDAPTVVIEINGGCICNVCANTDNIDVIVVDWDNLKRSDIDIPYRYIATVNKKRVKDADLATINRFNLKLLEK